MKKQKAIEHFGSETKIAKALGITKGAVNQWGEYIPWGRACEIALLTKGKLKAVKKPIKLKQAS